ncbi:hypothetical protein KAZ01_00445 [Candidatus Gracilibacteria bacterium]|nr:hypothetical protein [Candidatus Gracilibacteria bacterium]
MKIHQLIFISFLLLFACQSKEQEEKVALEQDSAKSVAFVNSDSTKDTATKILSIDDLPDEVFPVYSFPKKWFKKIYNRTIGNYRIRVWIPKDSLPDDAYTTQESEYIEVLRNDTVLIVLPEKEYTQWGNDNRDYCYHTLSNINIKHDYNADGINDLYFYWWSGGAHCCSNHYIFSLGESFRNLFQFMRLDGEPESLFLFKQLDDDPALEIETIESCFDYFSADPDYFEFSTSHVDSYFPRLVYKYKDFKYRIDLDLMKKDPPDSLTLRKWLKEVKKGEAEIKRHNDEDYITNVYDKDIINWRFLELMYTGNKGIAYEFLDKAFGRDVKSKISYLKLFEERLKYGGNDYESIMNWE